MTEPDNFILRWARLKREAHIDREVDNGECVGGSSREPQQAAAIEPGGASVRPRDDAAASETFDLSSLPSIESITSETDVRGFLQSSVPRELTIAALRRAWTSDPAIRDFIGIAESQWDFNDPNAMPGFGPLEITVNEPATFTKALDEFASEPASGLSAAERRIASPAAFPSKSSAHQPLQQNVVELTSTDANRLSDQKRVPAAGKVSTDTIEDNDCFERRSHHGSASSQ